MGGERYKGLFHLVGGVVLAIEAAYNGLCLAEAPTLKHALNVGVFAVGSAYEFGEAMHHFEAHGRARALLR